METHMDPDQFRTHDLYFAAYLKTAGVPFQGTESSDSGRVAFIFERIPNIRDLKNQFFTRKAKVSAMTYADEIKALKTLTHMGD